MKESPESAQVTDEELFVLVKQNNELAFRTLYRRYDKRLYAYCLRVMNNKQAAEDVFQTVVMTMWEKRDSFMGGSFAAWIFTISRNYCIKAMRKQRPKSDIDDVAYLLEDKGDKTGDDVILRDALKKAIDSLPEDFQEPLELRYYDGFSYEQIATMLNISLALAKVRVFRAKQQLQKSLSPYLQDLQ